MPRGAQERISRPKTTDSGVSAAAGVPVGLASPDPRMDIPGRPERLRQPVLRQGRRQPATQTGSLLPGIRRESVWKRVTELVYTLLGSDLEWTYFSRTRGSSAFAPKSEKRDVDSVARERGSCGRDWLTSWPLPQSRIWSLAARIHSSMTGAANSRWLSTAAGGWFSSRPTSPHRGTMTTRWLGNRSPPSASFS